MAALAVGVRPVMVKRVALVAGLLALSLAHAAAAETPPPAVSVYAPEDLASAVPAQVGGDPIEVHTVWDGTDMLAGANRDVLEGVLERLGTEPGQWHIVEGTTFAFLRGGSDDGYQLSVWRFEGVAAGISSTGG